MAKGWTRPPSDKSPFSREDNDRAGFIGNEFVVACRHCDKIHRRSVTMTRESLRQVLRDFEEHHGCQGCGRTLDVGTRKLTPRNSELREMEKAARWMTTDRGRPPTCEELWKWLEQHTVPIDPAIDYDEWGGLER